MCLTAKNFGLQEENINISNLPRKTTNIGKWDGVPQKKRERESEREREREGERDIEREREGERWRGREREGERGGWTERERKREGGCSVLCKRRIKA